MSDDIREWARAQGKDIGATGPIPRAVRAAYQAREVSEDAFPDETPEPDTEIPFSSPAGGNEVPPKQPTIGDRAKQSLSKGGRVRRGAKPKPAVANGKRASVEAILTGVYGALAGGVGKVNPAVGFMMGKQAPVAGMLLEDSVKGTVVDRTLQPFARNADKVRVGRALLGPPLLVAFMQAQPDKAPFIMPTLRTMLADYVDLAGPKIMQLQEREKVFEEKYGEAVDAILADLVTIINATNQARSPGEAE